MTDKIIWYKTFYNPIEANIIRAKLEDSAIFTIVSTAVMNLSR
jgi:hypothetical protein